MNEFWKLFSTFPLNYRLGVIYTMAIMPFYYLALFLFAPELLCLRIEIIVCICYCLSITWYLFWLIAMYLTFFWFIYDPKQENQEFIADSFISLIILSISI